MRIRPRALRVSMARYDVVVIGAGLGGLTAGAILARAGRKVLVIERNNSVGGAASSDKSGDLFVEGSLHLTSDPHDPRDPKHRALTRFGDNDAVKCALAANLSYYHDDPATLWWVFFAIAQGSYLLSGGRYVQGGSQRFSSALARAIKVAGGEVLVRRVVSGIVPGSQGHSSTVTHTARDGTDAQVVECVRIVGNAAPAALAPLMPAADAEKLNESDRRYMPSNSLFAPPARPSLPPGAIRRPNRGPNNRIDGQYQTV